MKVGLWRRLSTEELMLLKCGVGEDSWESLGLQGDPTSPFWRRSALGFLWKEWCWSWNSSTLATSCEELIHWKRLWCWEVPGASVRNSAHGKGHEEGGLAYSKAWSSLRKPPVPKHLPPKPESIYFTVSCSHLHLWLYGGLFPTGSLREGVNVQLQLIKIPGCDKSVSTYKLLWRFSSLPERVRPATCDCLQPPNHERHEML